jgi:steroid 5-alpha reductase family enzyme
MTEIWLTGSYGLLLMLLMGLITWFYSLQRNDVSIVDSLWSLMFLATAILYAFAADTMNTRNLLLLVLVSAWAIRLSVFLTIRNWGQEEDRRYQEIRANNQPNFHIKSLYLVFGLQAILAWVIAIPLLFAFSVPGQIGMLEIIATALWLIGFVIETSADQQLYQFKADPKNRGKVLNTGVWAYSRHPNYFGEFLIWWAYYLFALSVGAWWSVFSPLLMTVLLLRVSGVSLMEKDISERRAGYREYIETTNAFFPGIPHRADSTLPRGSSK